jgi:hypothetical protein
MYFKFIFVLILILVFIYFYHNILIENFNAYQTYQSYIPFNGFKFPMYPLVNPVYSSYWNGYYIPQSNGYTNLPWWNTSLGNTTNMSYDLRGDPLIVPRTNFIWNNGTNFPIYN